MVVGLYFIISKSFEVFIYNRSARKRLFLFIFGLLIVYSFVSCSNEIAINICDFEWFECWWCDECICKSKYLCLISLFTLNRTPIFNFFFFYFIHHHHPNQSFYRFYFYTKTNPIIIYAYSLSTFGAKITFCFHLQQ